LILPGNEPIKEGDLFSNFSLIRLRDERPGGAQIYAPLYERGHELRLFLD
jgi:hypothetical protein